MILKRMFSLVLAIMLLATCALAEDYAPAAAVAEWSAEDFNGIWDNFYQISGGVGSSLRESAFHISLAIEGETAVNTFTYPDGENVTNCTIEYAAENVILTYEDGSTADLTLLEDGTLQLHMEATAGIPETFMYFEKAES